MTAFSRFGLPSVLPLEKFLDAKKFDVFTFGAPSVALDIMTKVKGVNFENCYLLAENHYHLGLN